MTIMIFFSILSINFQNVQNVNFLKITIQFGNKLCLCKLINAYQSKIEQYCYFKDIERDNEIEKNL